MDSEDRTNKMYEWFEPKWSKEDLLDHYEMGQVSGYCWGFGTATAFFGLLWLVFKHWW